MKYHEALSVLKREGTSNWKDQTKTSLKSRSMCWGFTWRALSLEVAPSLGKETFWVWWWNNVEYKEYYFFFPKLGKKVTQDWLSSHSSFPTNHGKSQGDPSHTHQDAMFPSQVGVFMVLLEWSRHALRAAEPRGPQRSPRSPSCYCLSLLLA